MAETYANGHAVLAIAIFFPVLDTIAVGLRFYTSSKSKFGLGYDDWLVLPALALLWVIGGLLVWGTQTYSLGYHLPPAPTPGPDGYLFTTSDQQIRLQQIQYHVDWLGVPTLAFAKLSILFFYRKLFCPPSPKRDAFRLLTDGMIGLVSVWAVAFTFATIFDCKAEPTNAWAAVAVVAEKCTAQLPVLEGYAISDFILDCLIWTLPMPKIWTLRLPNKKKLAVGAVFLVGVLVIAASCARMAIYVVYVVNAFAQSDGETLITYLLFWTMIECGLGVLVVCLPALRSLFGPAPRADVLSFIHSAFSVFSLRSYSTSYQETVRQDSVEKSLRPSTSNL